MDEFWAAINAQLDQLSRATTADEVISILGNREMAGGADAHFGGSGGDGSVEGSLAEAGWKHVWRRAPYYWAMRAPNGDGITYVEGDISRGIQRPL